MYAYVYEYKAGTLLCLHCEKLRCKLAFRIPYKISISLFALQVYQHVKGISLGKHKGFFYAPACYSGPSRVEHQLLRQNVPAA
jgi:hypothetical protein